LYNEKGCQINTIITLSLNHFEINFTGFVLQKFKNLNSAKSSNGCQLIGAENEILIDIHIFSRLDIAMVGQFPFIFHIL